MRLIIEDLLNTRSVDITIDNILEGRLVAPQQFIDEEHSSPPIIVETVPQQFTDEEHSSSPINVESASVVNSVEQFINTPSPAK